jgi:hypothetical protein
MKKNEKCVTAGKKGADKRWATRHDIIKELTKIYRNDKKMMDKLQFTYKTEQLVELIKWVRKSNI